MTRRLVSGLAVALTAVLGTWTGPRPATADPVSSCTPTRGVIVAVDFGHWGRSIRRGCDATPSTAYDAVHAAGFSTAGTAHDGPAFVCRIDDFPTPAQDPCVRTPPASAYWSSWHADPGQDSWSYSSLGAMSFRPVAGSVEAWVFGATDVGGSGGGPRFPPSSVRGIAPDPAAPTTRRPPSRPPPPTPAPPTPRRTTPGRTTPAHTTAGSTSAQPTAASSAGAGTNRAGTSGAPGGPTSTPSDPTSPPASRPTATTDRSGPSPPSSSATGARATVQPSIVDQSATASAPPASSGSPVPFVLGGIVVVTLAAGAGWTAWRRRSGP